MTHFPRRYAGIKMPTRQLLKYKRADGVDLTATLWLPAGYDKSQGPLPTLMEAYPAEFKTRSAAEPGERARRIAFRVFGWGGSAVYFAQAGYAVLDNAAIPIIGEGDTAAERYVCRAAGGRGEGGGRYGVHRWAWSIPKRVGVMGHSYGAFMTANLLAHTNIFRAGIARQRRV